MKIYLDLNNFAKTKTDVFLPLKNCIYYIFILYSICMFIFVSWGHKLVKVYENYVEDVVFIHYIYVRRDSENIVELLHKM